MKHSIAIKFIAILLCAASLLAAAGSGLSIIVLTEYGLYGKTVEEIYSERMEDRAHVFAEQLAQNYASTHLGGCPEEMLGHYHYLNDGYYGYTLTDGMGNVLDSLVLSGVDGHVYSYEIPVSGSYMRVLNSYPANDNTTMPPESPNLFDEGYGVYDAIGGEPAPVFGFSYTYGDTSESFGSDEPIGILEHDAEGRAAFTGYTDGEMEPGLVIEPEHIVFYNENGEPIYEISGEGGVGELYTDAEGPFHFTAAVATAQDGPLVTPSPTEPVAEAAIASNPERFTYYDTAQGAEMVVEYEWDVMPAYTVSLSLLEGATADNYRYTLAGYLYGYRDHFPWLLGVGLLLFAITLVYLCCAAGRKPGSEEVRAGGLNRLPLDLYLGADALAVCGLAVACVEGGTSLFREKAEIGIGFAGATAYLMALLCVAFLFAFTAQIKTHGGYWWRNSVCGRFLILVVRFLRWVDKGAHKVWPAFCGGVRKGWSWFKRAVVATYKFIETALTVFCAFLIRAVKAIWKYGSLYTVKTYKFIVSTLTRFFRWLFRHMARFFSLLPLTWQWLMSGFALLLLMFLAVQAGSGGTLIFCLCGAFAIIFYGTHCFGVLLESARNMRKGDLETKVDDKLLIGSFKDFSTELNGLAGVATVAVQKQLKSERMKAELVTNVSHDIKTPLTSIINYVDLMKKPHTEEEHELYLEVLDRQSQRLKKLIEDLMEMSKASTGNLAVDLTQVDAAEAVNQALGEFSDKFHAANLTPVFHQPEEPVTILADGRLVWRVLSNLLSNAYKYALPGTRLYLDLLTLEGNAVITIKNISKEQLNVDAEELMERFVRGDASRNTEGSGLGLNIAKSLVELQGGKMELMVDGDLFKVTLLFPLA